MELKTEALFIYGCYAPETEVGCRARATYLPLAFFLPPSAHAFLSFSRSLSFPLLSPFLLYPSSLLSSEFYTTLREYSVVPIADIVLKQGGNVCT